MVLVLVATAALGLAVGSFLNVVAHRVPLALSVATPASRCPDCGHAIRNRHNVPVLGWLVLRGRCADCSRPISVRYPAVELMTAVLFVAVTARLLQLDLAAAVPAYLCFVAVGTALALIDLDARRLPGVITRPAYPVLAVLLTVAAVLSGAPGRLLQAAVGAAVLVVLCLLPGVVRPGATGRGVVEVAGLVGGVLGFLSLPVLVVGALVALALGAVSGLLLLPAHRGRVRAVPLGAVLVAGAVVAVLAGTTLAEASLGLHRA